MPEKRLSFTESVVRYKQTLEFNNDLLKRDYPDRYEFNTRMEVERLRKLGASDRSIAAYEERRTGRYNRRFTAYSVRLDAMVEPAVERYVSNLRSALGVG